MNNRELIGRHRAFRDAGFWQDDDLVVHFERHVEEQGGRIAVIDQSGAWTYSDLAASTSSIADRLAERGTRAGHVVSVQLPNHRSFVAVHLAVSRLGAVTNPLLMQYEDEQLAAVVTSARPLVAITQRSYRGRDLVARWEDVAVRTGYPRMLCVVSDDGFEIIETRARRRPRVLSSPDELSPTLLIYTSGTERAKGVVHANETLMYGVRSLASEARLPSGCMTWMPSPISHGTGLEWGVRMTLFLGGTLVLQDRWDANEALDLLERHPCHFTMGATTFLHDLVTAAEARGRRPRLDCFACGGAPIPPSLVDRAAAVGLDVLPVFGMTEHFVSLLVRPSDDPTFRSQSDGRALPGTEVVVRSDDGSLRSDQGASGELLVRGPGVALGYLDEPALTASTFGEDGWQSTGDVANVVGAGYFKIVARMKDIIIRGGLNIAPLAIEDALVKHSSIAEAAVIGHPDVRLGERICAVLVQTPDSDRPSNADVAVFVRAQGLASYLTPELIVWVESIPRTPSGKVRKDVVREHAAKDLAALGNAGHVPSA